MKLSKNSKIELKRAISMLYTIEKIDENKSRIVEHPAGAVLRNIPEIASIILEGFNPYKK